MRPLVVRFCGSVAAAWLAVLLSGCSGGLSLGNPLTTESVTPAPSAQAHVGLPISSLTLVSFAPISSAPDPVRDQFAQRMNDLVTPQKIALMVGQDTPIGLKGFVLANSDGKRVKVTYVWDSYDRGKACTHRLSGEQVVQAIPGKDAWAAVSPAVVDAVVAQGVRALQTCLSTPQPPLTGVTTATPTKKL